MDFLPESGFEPTTLGYLGFQVERSIHLANDCQVQTPDSCCAGEILKIDFSLIEKVNASVKYVIDDCSGLCNCTYCCQRGISNSHS